MEDKEEQPKEFDSGEQQISFNGLEIHFTLTTPQEACNLFLELREKLNDSPKKPGGYLG